MPRKPQRPRPKNDPAQHKRFIATAREVEVDEEPGALDRAFGRIAAGIKDIPRTPSPPLGKRSKNPA